VRAWRTDVPHASIEQVERAQLAVLAATDELYRPAYALLIDVRLAPPHNNPSSEAVVMRYHEHLNGGYRKLAGLVRLKVGRLRMARMTAAANAPPFRLFGDERATLDY
jgi:hypothetical protein